MPVGGDRTVNSVGDLPSIRLLGPNGKVRTARVHHGSDTIVYVATYVAYYAGGKTATEAAV